jgi:hypothetical protein
MTEEQIAKVICFSSEADGWWNDLEPLGVKHFPGKGGNFVACLKNGCECHLGDPIMRPFLHLMK